MGRQFTRADYRNFAEMSYDDFSFNQFVLFINDIILRSARYDEIKHVHLVYEYPGEVIAAQVNVKFMVTSEKLHNFIARYNAMNEHDKLAFKIVRDGVSSWRIDLD